jgi:hypothetical protein
MNLSWKRGLMFTGGCRLAQKHAGFKQTTHTSACGSASRAHVELIKEMGQKKSEENARDPTEHPKGPQRDPKHSESRRYGGPFWAPKHKNMHFTSVLDPRGCQHARKPCILQGFLNTRLSRRRLSARLSVVFRGLVLHWPPARNHKTRRTAGLRVAVSWGWL